MDLSEMSGCNNNDLLICGCCKRNFNLNNIVGFIKHKKFDCEDPGISADPKSKTLLCQSCHQKFLSPWSLLKHAQNVHFLQIYLENEYRLGRQAVTIHEECSVDTEWPLSQFSDHGTKSVLPESDSHVHENDAFSSAPEISGDGQNSSVVEPNQTPIEKSSLKSTQNNNEVFTAEKKNNPEKMNPVCDGSDSPVGSPVKSPVVSAADVSTPVLGSPGLLRSTSEIATQTKSRPGSASDAEQSTGSIKGLEKQVSSSKSENCCDSQDCGITVMPGTHESLKKCCSAVVPKKRKRHMEIKHKPGLLSRFRRRDKPRTSSPSIYIDMTPCAAADSTRGTRKSGAGSNTGAFPSAREKSVIIQPGSTFSIPVSYPIKGLGQAVDISGLNIKPVSFSLIPPNQNNSVSFGKASATATVTSSSDSLQNELSNRTQFAGTQIAPLPSMAHSSQDKSTSNFQMAEIDHNLINQILREQLENPPLISSKTGSTSSGALGPLVIDMERGNPMDISVPEVDIDLAQDGDERFSGVIDDARSPGGKKRRYPTSRPYKCDQCDDAFNQRVHLKKHQSKHTGIKPFKCDQCDYATVERSHLKVHIRVHTGEKPFKCTYCEYATAQNSTLKIHLKRHHGTNCRNFPCDSCGKEFRQKQMLDVHAAQEHITGTVGVENMEILQSSPVEQDLSAGTSNVATVVTPGELSQKTPFSESIDNKQASSESSTSDNGFHTISLISKDANLSKSDERETSPDSLEK